MSQMNTGHGHGQQNEQGLSLLKFKLLAGVGFCVYLIPMCSIPLAIF